MGINTQGLARKLLMEVCALSRALRISVRALFPTQIMKLRSRSSVPSSRRLPSPATLGAALLLLSALAVPAGAAIITVSGSLTATSDSSSSISTGTSIKVGDIFDYSFTFNDATTVTVSPTNNKQFGLGVSAVSLQRRGGNAGSWDPSGLTFTSIDFVIDVEFDAITLIARGSNFPAIESTPFVDLFLDFDWVTRDFLDNGFSQTFAQVVGTSPLNFATADETVRPPIYGLIRDSNYNSPSFTMTVNGAGGGASVPEGAVFAPLALGLGALLASRGRRR
jgi:hypothetical protein